MADDLIFCLQTLMRAERAGARVMLDNLWQTDEPEVRQRLGRLLEGSQRAAVACTVV